MANINCPVHDDRTASMTVYGPVAYCHVCRMSIPTSELNLPGNILNKPKLKPTNVVERIKYIKSLPLEKIRGLDLHTAANGFYILWPNNNYYKKRTNVGKSRYIGPAGVKAPLFVMPPGQKNHLVVIEGELNCMSLYEAAFGDYTFCSPGSAAEFIRHIPIYKMYKRVTLILDKDAAGIVHGSQTKDILLKSSVDARLVLVSMDYNEVLQKYGVDGVREHFEREIR